MKLGRAAILVTGSAMLSACAFLPLGPGIPDWALPELAALGDAAAQPMAESLELHPSDGFLVDVTIDGAPVRLRADTGHAGIVLNPDVAARLGLRSTARNATMVGPVRIDSSSAMSDVASGPGTSRQRVVWYETPITSDADGIINLANLPYRDVTMILADARAGETALVLPTEVHGGIAIVHLQQIAGRTIDMRFSTLNPRTFMTTAAGAHLAQTQGGTWSGEKFAHLIAFGVPRSVRVMDFASPLSIGGPGGLMLGSAVIRLRDFKGDTVLPAAEAPTAVNQVVIEGSQKSASEYFITVGQDLLSRCSRVTYTRETSELTLMCVPGT